MQKEEQVFISLLIQKRKMCQMTQQELANECDMDQGAIGRIESMNANPTLRTITKIVAAMNMQLTIVERQT